MGSSGKKEYVRECVEGSLKRLGIPCIDLYYQVSEWPSRADLCHSLSLHDCHTTLKAHLSPVAQHAQLLAAHSPCLFLGPA